jgi:twitching motility protein PilJ
MGSAREDNQKKYEKAVAAYLAQDYEQANRIADSMAEDYPDDPQMLLLKGHIFLHQRQFALAKEKYHAVMEITDQEELITSANQGLERISMEEQQEAEEGQWEDFEEMEVDNFNFDEDNNDDLVELEDDEDWTNNIKFENMDWDDSESEDEDLEEDPTLQQVRGFEQDFEDQDQSLFSQDNQENNVDIEDVFGEKKKEGQATGKLGEENFLREEEIDYDDYEDFDPDDLQDTGIPTFVVSSQSERPELELNDLEKMFTSPGNDVEDEQDYEDYSSELEPLISEYTSGKTSSHVREGQSKPLRGDNHEDLLFSPDDLDDIPDISDDELPVSGIFSKYNTDFARGLVRDSDFHALRPEGDRELAEPTLISDHPPTPFSPLETLEVEVPQGNLGKFFDAPLPIKEFISASTTGIITFLAILMFGLFGGTTNPEDGEQKNYLWLQTALISLVGGIASGGTSLGIGFLLFNKHLKRYQSDLQTQFESISQGNFNVKATIYSQDEFGQLAASFNKMTKVINTTTTEAKKRAEETERAREDLQRQVIRLLDDVEGAARGDLTVQAEVTADVLGAVADAFNLSINSLREIVTQVKKAALQVNKGSTDSELYARNQSSDALRMAEELAVTLNSVQMMTDSIQRVAENAREAEEVARSSSVTALRGGEAVERTVAGILQIRETVSETTRKVKRLAEASQQISTIVAVISQISSRTNLLALNASIQAARAGEAGRGFAIVADEVRQLADRSAKSLQEIEQIVLQIQTETGSVMTAMEEGIQQVIDVTERSEQAKRSLEDIIQVSNRIDALVRSITADTVEQRENSRAVARVMQAVELTAQATSQESQRVAGALQHLVSIGRDLMSSVEKFKVGENDHN